MQEGTEAQQIGGSFALPFDALEGQRPSGCYCIGILLVHTASLFEQVCSTLEVEFEVSGEATAGTVDVGCSLSKRERETTELFDDGLCCFLLRRCHDL